MNKQQITTLKLLGIAGLGSVLLVAYLLFVEGHAVVVGGHSTISELIWLAWATQPGAIFLLSHLISAPIWFLGGHFFWQASDKYDQIRKGGL